MKTISLTFELHEPVHLKRYRFFDIGADHNYLDIGRNRYQTRQMALASYIPVNEMLEKLLRRYAGNLRIGLYVSGTAMEQFRSYAPEVVKGLKRIAASGYAELIGGTYSYSLSSLAGEDAFGYETYRHSEMLYKEFGQAPETFFNTRLLYSDEIGRMVAQQGYKSMMIDGSEYLLGWKSPNYIYANALQPKLRLSARNSSLSRDITEFFSADISPVTAADEIAMRIDREEGEVINIMLRYRDICGSVDAVVNSLKILELLTERTIGNHDCEYAKPQECRTKLQPVGILHAHDTCMRTGDDLDLYGLLGNELQQEAFSQIYSHSPAVFALGEKNYTHVWEFMQGCEHFEQMSAGGTGRSESDACEAFINYMNILNDYALELDERLAVKGTNFEHVEVESFEYEYENS